MSFSDAIFTALTGRQRQPTTAAEMFHDIEQYRYEIGMSRRAFAKQTGIPESTLRLWGQQGFSSKSAGANLPRLTRAYRQLISSPAAVARWKNNDLSITVDGIPRTARDVSADKLRLRAGTGAAVVNAFMQGDDTEAAKIFARGVQDPFYRGSVFGDWIGDDDGAYHDGYETDDGYLVQVGAH